MIKSLSFFNIFLSLKYIYGYKCIYEFKILWFASKNYHYNLYIQIFILYFYSLLLTFLFNYLFWLKRLKLFQICMYCDMHILLHHYVAHARELDIILITKIFYWNIMYWNPTMFHCANIFHISNVKIDEAGCNSIFTSLFPSIPFRRHPWRVPPSPRRADAIRAHHHRLPRQG